MDVRGDLAEGEVALEADAVDGDGGVEEGGDEGVERVGFGAGAFDVVVVDLEVGG